MTEPTRFLPGDLFADELYCDRSTSIDLRLCVSSERVISYLFVRTDIYDRADYTGSQFHFGTAHNRSDIGDLICRAE